MSLTALALLIIWGGVPHLSGTPSHPNNPNAAAPGALDAVALCAAIREANGMPADTMGAAWQPGSDQTASCWDIQTARKTVYSF